MFLIAAFAGLGLLYVAQSWFQTLAQGEVEPIWLLFRRQGTIWAVRGALAVLVFRLCDMLRSPDIDARVRGATHVFAALTYGLVAAVVIVLIEYPLGWGVPGMKFWPLMRLNLLATTAPSVLTYVLIALSWSAAAYYDDARRRELRESELEAELARSRLQLLRSQLQPHFLFNTLNTVSGLMSEDVRGARVMLGRLAGLLRMSLDTVDRQEIPLADELQLVREYIDIQQVRFGDRLRTTYDVDEGALDALVPSFLLQPIIENAIRHGVEPRSGGGDVMVRATVSDGVLRLRVRDNGPGLGGNGATGSGLGLGNTRERLHQLYGDAQRLELLDAPGEGLTVNIELPFHVRPVEPRGATPS